MSRSRRSEEKKIRTIETWIQSYANNVFQLALLYTGDSQHAQTLTVNAFAHAYRRMDLVHVYLTDKNALFGGVVTACREFDAMTYHNEDGQAAESSTHVQAEIPVPELKSDGPRRTELLKQVLQLSPEIRVVLLMSTVGDMSTSDISRILLLPKRVLNSRLQAGITKLQSGLNDVQTQVDGNTKESLGRDRFAWDELTDAVASIEASEALLVRIHKVLSATVQEVQADRRHRGPSWLKYAAIGTGLVSIAAVDVGYHQVKHTQIQSISTPTPVQQTSGLPTPLTGLPVQAEVQFKLNTMPDVNSLDHAAFTNTGVYVPTLEQSANSWPSIQVAYAPYTAKGQEFGSALQALSTIGMVLPIEQQSTVNAASSDWKIVNWNFQVTGDWAVASVNWMSAQSLDTVMQLYLLHIPSGDSNLVLSVGSANTTGTSQLSAVSAVGNGRVIVQKVVANTGASGHVGGISGTGNVVTSAANQSSTNAGNPGTASSYGSSIGSGVNRPTNISTANATGSGSFRSTSRSGGTPVGNTASQGSSVSGNNAVGLPLDVYQLSGYSPLHALGTPTQIPALSGLMKNPTVFSSGILFMGVAGQPSDVNDANSTWYQVSWNGSLTQYVGPPLDGQPHFAVIGSNGDLWWAETTPNQGAQTDARWQVLMSTLTGDSVGASAALNLNGPVDWFGASENHISWVQDTNGQLQLVVATVK